MREFKRFLEEKGEEKLDEEAKIVKYSPKLDIQNISSLPKGTGAKYLEVIEGEGGAYVAKAWRRSLPKKGMVVEFK